MIDVSNRAPRGPSKKGIEGRLWEKISPEPNSGCWLWMAGGNQHGYGSFYVNGRQRGAHIACYEHYIGPVPDGLELDHKCRVPCCVNPSHLEPVTHQENVARGAANESAKKFQGAKTHCPSGHPYTEDNIYFRKNGHRDCRTCSQERSKKYQAHARKNRTPEQKNNLREYWKLRARRVRSQAKS